MRCPRSPHPQPVLDRLTGRRLPCFELCGVLTLGMRQTKWLVPLCLSGYTWPRHELDQSWPAYSWHMLLQTLPQLNVCSARSGPHAFCQICNVSVPVLCYRSVMAVLKILLGAQRPRGRDLRQHTAAAVLMNLLPSTSRPASSAGAAIDPKVTTADPCLSPSGSVPAPTCDTEAASVPQPFLSKLALSLPVLLAEPSPLGLFCSCPLIPCTLTLLHSLGRSTTHQMVIIIIMLLAGHHSQAMVGPAPWRHHQGPD